MANGVKKVQASTCPVCLNACAGNCKQHASKIADLCTANHRLTYEVLRRHILFKNAHPFGCRNDAFCCTGQGSIAYGINDFPDFQNVPAGYLTHRSFYQVDTGA